MSDSDVTAAPPPSQVTSEQSEDAKKVTSGGISFSIWPPSQRTRDAVITRLIETLSTPSVLSKRYGTVPQEEADSTARKIEEEAFAVANFTAGSSSEDDGLEVLQLYSKEISKRMLDTVKARGSSGVSADNNGTETSTTDVAPDMSVKEEDAGTVETEN